MSISGVQLGEINNSVFTGEYVCVGGVKLVGLHSGSQMATCRSVFSTFTVDPMIKLGSLGLCGRCFKKKKKHFIYLLSHLCSPKKNKILNFWKFFFA